MSAVIDDHDLTSLALIAGTGVPADIEAFVRMVYPDVRRFLSYLAGAQDAEDLAQETFVRVLRSLPTFAGRSSARTWLLTIARRVVIDRYRAAACRPVSADLADWQAAVEARPSAALPGPEDQVLLELILADLPPDRRVPFVLTQFLGLSYAEAAERLQCPIGTVRSRVARARTHLIGAIDAA